MFVWKDVIGYEDYYQISSYGVVRTKPRKVKGRWGEYIRSRKNLGRFRDKYGFYRVTLRKDGKNLRKACPHQIPDNFSHCRLGGSDLLWQTYFV